MFSADLQASVVYEQVGMWNLHRAVGRNYYFLSSQFTKKNFEHREIKKDARDRECRSAALNKVNSDAYAPTLECLC